MVACVQVTQLVEFFIEHHEELFGEDVADLANTSAEELPALGQKQKLQSYVRSINSVLTKASTAEGGPAAAGTSKVIHLAQVQSNADAGWPWHFVR